MGNIYTLHVVFHCPLKHGASLYLKFEGLNLSIIIIFKVFHWLKNDESLFSRQCGSPLRVVAGSPAKSDFVLLREDLLNYCRADLLSRLPDNYLAYSFNTLTLFTSISLKKNLWTVNVRLDCMFYTRSAKPVTIYARVSVRWKARKIF